MTNCNRNEGTEGGDCFRKGYGKNDRSQKKSNIFVLICVAVNQVTSPAPLLFSIVPSDADQFDNF